MGASFWSSKTSKRYPKLLLEEESVAQPHSTVVFFKAHQTWFHVLCWTGRSGSGQFLGLNVKRDEPQKPELCHLPEFTKKFCSALSHILFLLYLCSPSLLWGFLASQLQIYELIYYLWVSITALLLVLSTRWHAAELFVDAQSFTVLQGKEWVYLKWFPNANPSPA